MGGGTGPPPSLPTDGCAGRTVESGRAGAGESRGVRPIVDGTPDRGIIRRSMTTKAKLETAAAIAAIIGAVVGISAWLMPFDPVRPSPVAKAPLTEMTALTRSVD